jgi:hypothetical protein
MRVGGWPTQNLTSRTANTLVAHCHAALNSRKMHSDGRILHSNPGIYAAFVLKSRIRTAARKWDRFVLAFKSRTNFSLNLSEV